MPWGYDFGESLENEYSDNGHINIPSGVIEHG